MEGEDSIKNQKLETLVNLSFGLALMSLALVMALIAVSLQAHRGGFVLSGGLQNYLALVSVFAFASIAFVTGSLLKLLRMSRLLDRVRRGKEGLS
ncbi:MULTISPECIES: hypothetical protein [unclassified Thioalkalivibrio]|uniref:hypothetical protein n=1 Tax=unclassified Thioalkalivibrio TaxID=2621013 RepID=UPI0003A8BB15|nr:MULTISPECIES: hypothetical protein [unclassified Thioalkalivibrio]